MKISVQDVATVARTNNLINEAAKKYYIPLRAKLDQQITRCKSAISSCSTHLITSRTK